MFNIPLMHLLSASAILAVLGGITGFFIAPNLVDPTIMYFTPTTGTVVIGETFELKIHVKSNDPVNVFNGEIAFDENIISIQSIDYNTSIADLWAEKPWFSNGEGTLNFTGGTTRSGGFTGDGTLITITFNTIKTGEANIKIIEAHILKHDGLGTDSTLEKPIDALFAVNDTNLIVPAKITEPKLTILESEPSTDLNNDGKQTIADISIFMADLATQNMRSDFNGDGVVNLKDLSILTK